MTKLEEYGYRYVKQQIDKMIDGTIPVDTEMIKVYNEIVKK